MNEENEYLNLIRKIPLRDVKFKSSERREAWKKQKGECAVCKTKLNPFYSKFIRKNTGSPSQEFMVVCLNCENKVKK